MDAEIVVRIFNKPIPCRTMPGRRLVLPLGLRALRRLWFDRRRGLWLRLVIFGGKIDCRYFRQGLLRSQRERFRDADGLRCLERRTLRGSPVGCPIQAIRAAPIRRPRNNPTLAYASAPPPLT